MEMNQPYTVGWSVPQDSANPVRSFQQFMKHEHGLDPDLVLPQSFFLRGNTRSVHTFSNEILDDYLGRPVVVTYVLQKRRKAEMRREDDKAWRHWGGFSK